MDVPPIITVDGPGGAGKGTLCFSLASKLSWHMLDSGALDRVTALAALHAGQQDADEQSLAAIALDLPVSFQPAAEGVTRVELDGRDVSLRIREEDCSALASKVAAMKAVRSALLDRQRAMAQAPGLVADGRDMGTVVFPDAGLKVFLTATAEARARRRQSQLLAQGQSVTLARLLETIEERDARDRSRAESTLVPAADAVQIDSTGLTAAQELTQDLAELEARSLF